MINYRETTEVTKENKKKYLSGIETVILERKEKLSQKRAEYCKDIFTNTEKYRDDLKEMLGWPLIDYSGEGLPSAKATRLSEENGVTVYRMVFEIVSGVEMSGLYFEVSEKEKRPLVLVQHGGLGTPELVSGFYDGITGNYNDMLERVLACGVHVFAPQLLLWDNEKYDLPFDRANIDMRLKHVGGSITALELFGMQRILDYFETKENVSVFGMVGMSYGGFYTLFLSALDTRIKAALSSSFFNSRDNVTWSDWTWFNSASKFDDAEIACMTYPRHLCIAVGKSDEIFDVKYGEASFERLQKMCEKVGTDWVSFITFDGVHEFIKDDAPIKELVKRISKDN